MKTEIIIALIGVLSVFISSFVSWVVSKRAAQSEIKKLVMTWEHEIERTKEPELKEMVSAVSAYIAYPNPRAYHECLKKVGLFLPSCSGELAEKMDTLSNSLRTQNTSTVDAALRNVLKQIRHNSSK